MTEHPEDTPLNRFLAFWWALGAILAFGALAFFFAGAKTIADDKSGFEDARVVERIAKLKAVREAQEKLLNGTGEVVDAGQGRIRIPVAVAAKVVLRELQSSSPKASQVPVPGTAAAMELMKKQATEQATAAAEAEAAKPVEPANPEKDQ